MRLISLENHLLDKKTQIESWFATMQENNDLLTCSVDLRNAGFKIAPIDVNLFPAGFNNLDPSTFLLCVDAAKENIHKNYKNCKKILIIPESHTRNPYYFQSIAHFKKILEQSGFEVKIGSLLATKPVFIAEYGVTFYPVTQKDNRLVCDDMVADLIILNNDLSEGIPEILQHIAQPITPSLELGWHIRSKAKHFEHYYHICQLFSDFIGLDPWLFFPLFSDCRSVNFMEKEGLDCIYEKTKNLFLQIQEKYKQYDIKNKPFVIIKSDFGTYGMNVLSVNSADLLLQLNRKQRSTMSNGKGKRPVNHVIIQEGIPTIESHNEAVKEPVIYLIGQRVAGGFYRMHPSRGIDENLNTPGMQFLPISNNLPYAYSVIARLSLLAANQE